MGEYVNDLVNMYMTCCSGFDYDGIKFDIGTVDAFFEDQVTVLFTDKLVGSSTNYIVFSVPAVRRWVDMYGRERAKDITAFCIAHSMGTIKLSDDMGFKEMGGRVIESEESIARSDAYAREVMGVSKEFTTDLLTDLINTVLGGTNVSMWRKAVISTKIESRVDRMAVKKYLWEGQVPDLSEQLYTWADMVVCVCKDAYLERIEA